MMRRDDSWKLVTLVTPTKLESLNVLLYNDRRHWRVNWRTKNGLIREMWALIAPYKDILKRAIPGQKRTAQIISVRKHLLDEDNLKGGAKPWFDALKEVGGLENDDPDHAELIVEQRKPTVVDMDGELESEHTEVMLIFQILQ